MKVYGNSSNFSPELHVHAQSVLPGTSVFKSALESLENGMVMLGAKGYIEMYSGNLFINSTYVQEETIPTCMSEFVR